VLGSYLVALVPAVVMASGAVLLVEMSFRVSTEAERGTQMRVLGIAIDAATPWPWIGAVLLLVVGFIAFRATWGRVASTWGRATDEAASRRAVATERARP
jgi:hypothetical protein